ncbi:MAG: XRE family transcriptional regulator [Boseongicola sp.]|nr:XRE family transcriptional regulator [Boseongicola sp.]
MPDSLGRDIRALRKSRKLTLSELAEKLGRSVGWMSQVERDLSEPSMREIKDLARAFDVPVQTLYGHAPAPAAEAAHIVRANARRPMGHRADGLAEDLLSPDLTDDFEVVHATFAPLARRDDPVSRPTQEVGYIISGALDLTVDGTTHRLNPGDSFRIRGEPFSWANPNTTPCIAIWVIAPPVY